MPGVPPDAMDNLKRAFKGLFKRGKKSKTDSTATSTTTDQPPQSSTGSQAAPPQLPPIQNSSPIQTATDTSKPLPPTHPLSTGKHDEPVEAVPPNRNSLSGPPAPVVGPAETAGQVQEQQKQDTTSPISPPEPGSAVGGAKSGEVSAVTKEASPQSSPNMDGAVEEKKTEEPAVPTILTTAATNENTPPTTTTTTTTTNTTTTVESSSSPTTSNPTTNGAPAAAPASASAPTPAPQEPEPTQDKADEKVAVMDEPPAIKTSKPAPGMSATSGPLEDFPEGGDPRDM